MLLEVFDGVGQLGRTLFAHGRDPPLYEFRSGNGRFQIPNLRLRILVLK
jgi:hypothetical protein